ncbi:MAG: hypothetical protein LBM02_06260, partial [Lachnospiraceae bacterium]|jgi:hypothetical protein|nr:hypothetical protein [Lachnospiraceae bacterium]
VSFHIDEKEITNLIKEYTSKEKSVEEQLIAAKNSLNDVIKADAIKGVVATSIKNNINNHHNAILVAIMDSYKLLLEEMKQKLEDFQYNIGEFDGNAVLDEEAIISIRSEYIKYQMENDKFEADFLKIIRSIDDLLPLYYTKARVNDKFVKINVDLTSLQRKANEFCNKKKKSEIEKEIQLIKQQITKLNENVNLSYSDPKFSQFASEASFSDGVKQLDKDIKENEKKKKELEKEMDWLYQHRRFNMWDYESARGNVKLPNLHIKEGLWDLVKNSGKKVHDNSIKWMGKNPRLGTAMNKKLGNFVAPWLSRAKNGFKNISVKAVKLAGKIGNALEKRPLLALKITKAAKIISKALPLINFLVSFTTSYMENHNVGRALSYALYSTLIPALVEIPLVIAGAPGIIVAAFSILASVIAELFYEYNPWVRKKVDYVGDIINDAFTKAFKGLRSVTKNQLAGTIGVSQ